MPPRALRRRVARSIGPPPSLGRAVAPLIAPAAAAAAATLVAQLLTDAQVPLVQAAAVAVLGGGAFVGVAVATGATELSALRDAIGGRGPDQPAAK